MNRWHGLLMAGVLAAGMTGCGGDDPAEPRADAPVAAPSYVESDLCRTKAASVVEHAESLSTLTDVDQVTRYANAFPSTEDLGCSPEVLQGLLGIFEAIDRFKTALTECQVSDQWLSFRDDGSHVESDSCPRADEPYAEMMAGIRDTKALLELKS